MTRNDGGKIDEDVYGTYTRMSAKPLIHSFKTQVIQKWKCCHFLLILMS